MDSDDRFRVGGADGGGRFSLETPDFDSVLQAFKRHGCNLLITGEASEDVVARLARRFFGDPDQRRFSLLALTDVSPDDAGPLLPKGLEADAECITIMSHDDLLRFVEAESGSESSISDRSDVAPLQAAIRQTIAEYESREELGPAELRLGVVTLRPLIDAYDIETVNEFVRSVGTDVLEVRGMAHYWLPLPDDDPTVKALAPAFDARIEVKKGNGSPPSHRWHVPEYDLTTPWLEI